MYICKSYMYDNQMVRLSPRKENIQTYVQWLTPPKRVRMDQIPRVWKVRNDATRECLVK